MHKIFICITIKDRIKFTLACIKSIYAQNYKNIQIIISDDASIDNSAEIIKSNFSDVIILKGDGNLWWTGGINLCIKEALKLGDENDFIFTLNNDTILPDKTFQILIQHAHKYPKIIIGILNRIIDDRNKIECSAFLKRQKGIIKGSYYAIFNTFDSINKIDKEYYEVDSLTGKGVLIPLVVFNEIGCFNDSIRHYHADTEFFIRAKNNNFNLHYLTTSFLYSDTKETGIGTKYTNKNFIQFIKSFFTLKSPHFLPALVIRSKLIYNRFWPYYFLISFLGICGGYIKRVIK